jgi:hypothetical protein
VTDAAITARVRRRPLIWIKGDISFSQCLHCPRGQCPPIQLRPLTGALVFCLGATANECPRGGDLADAGATMSTHEFVYAAEAHEIAARPSTGPLPVLTAAAPGSRKHETDLIMDALLRDCLGARRPPHAAATPLA